MCSVVISNEDFLVFYEEAEFASKLLKKEELLLIFVFKLNGLPNKRFKFVSDFTADIDDLSVAARVNLEKTREKHV